MATISEAVAAIEAAEAERAARRALQPTTRDKKNFYSSWAWRRLRYQVLMERGRVCECCGARVGEPEVVISVDHIIPVSKRWDLRYDKTNCQVMCMACQMGKSNTDTTDFRPAA